MATPIVEFAAPSGMTLTATLHTIGSDTVLKTASSVVEQTNRKGIYRATFNGTGLAYARYQIVAKAGTSGVAVWYGYASDDNMTFSFGEYTTALDNFAQSSISEYIATDIQNATSGWDIALQEIAGQNWTYATRTITGGTITTVSDKTGYSLTQVFPANFSVLSISAQGAVTSSGSGGSTVVAIAPSAALTNYIEAIMVSQAENPHPLTCPYLAQKTFSISIYSIDAESGDKTAVSMEGKNLEVVFESTSGSDLAVINNASITKTQNTVVFTNPVAASTPPNSQRKMTGKWAIREVSTGYPWAFGSWEIIDCAFKDA